ARIDNADGSGASQATAGDTRGSALAYQPTEGVPLPSALPAGVRSVHRRARARGSPARGVGTPGPLLARGLRQTRPPRGRGANRARQGDGRGVTADTSGDERLREAEQSLAGAAQPLVEVEHMELYFPVK